MSHPSPQPIDTLSPDARKSLLNALLRRILDAPGFTRRPSPIAVKLLEILFNRYNPKADPISRQKLAALIYGKHAADNPGGVDRTVRVASAVSRLRTSLQEYFKSGERTEPFCADIFSDKKGYWLELGPPLKTEEPAADFFWGPYIDSDRPTTILFLGLPYDDNLPGQDHLAGTQEFSEVLNACFGFGKVLLQKNKTVSVSTTDEYYLNQIPSDDPLWQRNLLIVARTEEHLRRHKWWHNLVGDQIQFGFSDPEEGWKTTIFRGSRLVGETPSSSIFESSQFDGQDDEYSAYVIVTRIRQANNCITVFCAKYAIDFSRAMNFLLETKHLDGMLNKLVKEHSLDSFFYDIEQIMRDVYWNDTVPSSGWQLVLKIRYSNGDAKAGVDPVKVMQLNIKKH